MKPRFIKNIRGELVEITNFKLALKEARDAVRWHRIRKEIKYDYMHPDKDNIIYFPEAHKSWEYILNKLKNLNISDISLLHNFYSLY